MGGKQISPAKAVSLKRLLMQLYVAIATDLSPLCGQLQINFAANLSVNYNTRPNNEAEQNCENHNI